MVKSCCVVGCTANKAKNPDISFYMIPNEATEPERRLSWLAAIDRATCDDHTKAWVPKSDYTYVCSQHFVTSEGLLRKIWKISNGHISGTRHPIHFVFDSRVGFSRSSDQMALFPVGPNPRSRPLAVLHNFEWPYL